MYEHCRADLLAPMACAMPIISRTRLREVMEGYGSTFSSRAVAQGSSVSSAQLWEMQQTHPASRCWVPRP
jgi:hypothetical protein